MPWAGRARRWAVFAFIGALIASIGPASLAAGTPGWAVTGKAVSLDAGTPHGRRPAKPSRPAVSIAARIAHVAGGRKVPRRTTCPVTVTLAVTVSYRKPARWARHDMLLYQAPHGIRVIVRPPARRTKPAHGRKSKPAPKRATHPDTTSTRLELSRPQHGRTTVTLRLSAPTISIQVHPKHRPKRRALVVRVGGTVRVLRGRATLAKTTLRLQAPIACASPAPGRHRPRPSATPTSRGAKTPVGSATASTGASVTIQNFAFSPTPITVVAGSTVTWTNKDSAGHTVSADDGSWGSGNLGQGATYSHTFDKPGTYTYHCAIHPFMHGTVVVTATQPAGLALVPTATPTATPSATQAPAATGTSPPGGTAQVTIMDTPGDALHPYAFSPAAITVSPGTTVIWTNQSGAAHTVSADDGSWGSGSLATGATYSYTFNTPGTYSYHCAIHPFMHGQVTVVAPGAPTPTAAPTNTATATATSSATPTNSPTLPPGAPSNTPTSTPVVAMVTIVNVPANSLQPFAFSPATITVAPGTTVVWTNGTDAPHTVTADDGSWGSDLSHPLNQGDTYSYTFQTPGVYSYQCAIHPFMHGTVIVGTPPPTATSSPTATPTTTPTPSATATATNTATLTPSATSTATATVSPTITATAAPTDTPSATATPTTTATAAPTSTGTVSASPTPTTTASATATSTATNTAIPSSTASSTPTAAGTATATQAPSPTSTPRTAVATVTIKNFAFQSSTITVTSGTAVVWTNEDTITHTVTAAPGSGSWDSGDLGPDRTFERTFALTGTTTETIGYYCSIHTFMHGIVVVISATTAARASVAQKRSLPSYRRIGARPPLLL